MISTPVGVMATRFSSGFISFNIPTIIFIHLKIIVLLNTSLDIAYDPLVSFVMMDCKGFAKSYFI
jgi:hypothetical protein